MTIEWVRVHPNRAIFHAVSDGKVLGGIMRDLPDRDFVLLGSYMPKRRFKTADEAKAWVEIWIDKVGAQDCY